MLNLESLTKEELIKRLNLAMDVATAVDGMWFMAVEKENGYDRALEMDIGVWKRYPKVLKKRLIKYYEFKNKGLEAVQELIESDPMLLPMEFEFIKDGKNTMVFKVNKCPALEAMERIGRKKLTCEPVETVYLEGIAKLCDERIEIKAIKLPPRNSKADGCCEWRFTLNDT
jgi:hypothetical protein